MLKAKYRTGSIQILPKHRDIDFVYYYETKEERLEALRNNQELDVNIHFDVFPTQPRITTFCYLYPLMELIEGEECEALKTFNVCDHKHEYKKVAMKFVERMKDNDKRWYHILIACYMFENNKNAITEEQKENAQAVHDNGITEELKEYCINILNKIK